MKQKKPTPSKLQKQIVANGEATQKRVEGLVKSAEKGDSTFHVEMARSMGNVEGKTTLTCDLMQKFVVPTLLDHEERLTGNRWRIRGIILLLFALSGGFWWLGTTLFEKVLLK